MMCDNYIPEEDPEEKDEEPVESIDIPPVR